VRNTGRKQKCGQNCCGERFQAAKGEKMPNRRDFIKSVMGASAGVVFTGCAVCDAMAARLRAQVGSGVKHKPAVVGKRRVKTVDIHCHVSVPEATDLLKGTKIERRLGAGIALGGYDDAGLAPTRIQIMDEMGIDVQAVSINAFWYSADQELATKLIDLQNQKLAEMCAAHAERFVAFASVALQFPELAAQQLETGIKKYGLRGVAIGGSCEGKELSSPEFEPFWAKAQELQALVFIHPQDSANATGVKNRVQGNGVLTNVIGNPLETTICLSHLIMEGTLDKFPNLKICAAHGGGFLPSYDGRLDQACRVFPKECTKKILKQPSEYLKQIYVDTIIFNPEGLRHLIAVVGAGQIGLGTDYPFPWAYTPVDDVMSQPGLSDADRIAILGGTMSKLLNIPA
jgi:aminocarboxymuconate-semialdehyde decarboxylase